MLNLKIGEKEYKIKFGYKPTLKSGIISRMVKNEKALQEKGGAERIEELLLFVPEIILVGLQVNHRDEFGYNYDTNDGKEEKLDVVYDMMDKYFEGEDADFGKLYTDLQTEMLEESFLRSMFQTEEKKQGKK